MTKTFLAYWDKIINSLMHEISKVGDGFVCNSPGINPGKEQKTWALCISNSKIEVKAKFCLM